MSAIKPEINEFVAAGQATKSAFPVMQNVYARLKQIAAQFPDQTAIVCDNRSVTYAELIKEIEACVNLIKQADGENQAAVILFPNSIEFVVCVFAIFAVNGIVVALNPGFTEAEIRQYIKASAPRIVFSDDTTIHRVNLRTSFNGVIYNLADFEQAEAKPIQNSEIDPDRPALYMFSSGSTGKSKRVTRTQRQILSEYSGMAATIALSPSDRILCTIPLYHAHGFCNAMLAALLTGGRLILLTSEFNARRTLQTIENHQATLYPAVPFMYKMMANTRLNQSPDLNSLRLLISAGAPLTNDIAAGFCQRFGKAISQLYGSTETGAISVNANRPWDKPLSVGLPISGVKIEVRDEQGNVLPCNTEGEIWINSPAMTFCYDGLSELSSECFVDSWFFAGDLGLRDEDGYLYITGRKKLMYIVGGNKVDPLEVEGVLRGHEKVNDVVVIGVPHPDYGQMIKAFVVPAEGSDCTESELIQYAKCGLAEYKIPKQVQFIAEIPRSPLGKILRKYLE